MDATGAQDTADGSAGPAEGAQRSVKIDDSAGAEVIEQGATNDADAGDEVGRQREDTEAEQPDKDSTEREAEQTREGAVAPVPQGAAPESPARTGPSPVGEHSESGATERDMRSAAVRIDDQESQLKPAPGAKPMEARAGAAAAEAESGAAAPQDGGEPSGAGTGDSGSRDRYPSRHASDALIGGERTAPDDRSGAARHDSADPAHKLAAALEGPGTSPDAGNSPGTSLLQLEAEAPAGTKLGGPLAGRPVNVGASQGQAPQGSSDAEAGFGAGVSRGLAAALQQKGGSLTIRLSPASLGSLRIEMTLGEGQVSVRMETLNEQAQQMLMRSMPVLKDSLESKGLTVRDIQVTPTLHQASGAHQSADTRQQSQHDQHAWDEGRGDGDQPGGGGREGESGARRDGREGSDDLSEQWFEQRLRMTLNAVA
ncbi:MAG: flagellar hook-length control protein FliK [Phycisphaerales bacterium]|nr:flagellar hook-length control protein FliK [Phycisphaerales bacterium]